MSSKNLIHRDYRDIIGVHVKRNIFEWTSVKPHPMVGTREVRILGGKPREADFPLFHIYASNAQLVRPSYIRYLTNKIHSTYDYNGCPVVVEFMKAGRKHSGIL